MKSCITMQCANCSKYVQTHTFCHHVQQCMGGSVIKDKVHHESNKENMQIWVSKTQVKMNDEKKKPYTQYKIKVTVGDNSWNVAKRYKQFSQLQQVQYFITQMLINRYPSIKYPQSSNSLVDINNLMVNKQKNMMSEQRRKTLQVYLRDLIKIDEIRNSDILRTFLDCPDAGHSEKKSHFKQNQMYEKRQRLFL